MTTEVKITCVWHPYLQNVRALQVQEVDDILQHTRRPLRHKFQNKRVLWCGDKMMVNSLRTCTIGCGSGCLIRFTFFSGCRRSSHATVLWRGEDGDFFFFNSMNCLHPEVDHYIQSKYPDQKLYTTTRRLQGEECGSCLYHSLAFADFISRNSFLPTHFIADSFEQYMGYLADVKAVQIVQEIMSEYPNTINIRSGLKDEIGVERLYSQQYSPANSIAYRVKLRHRLKRGKLKRLGALGPLPH